MKQNMRLCVLTSGYPSKGRFVFVFVEQLVNALVDLGVEVSVVAPQSLTQCLFRKIPVLPQKQVHYTSQSRQYDVYRPYSISFGNGKKLLYKLVSRFNSRRLTSCVDLVKPDVLYAHFFVNACKLVDYALQNQKPLFVACGEGDNALEELVATISADEKSKLTRAIKGVISVSSENKRKCVEYGLVPEDRIVVLPNAVDTNVFHPMSKNYELRTELHVTQEDFLLLFVGSFIPRKGSGILAKAINQIHDEHIKIIFAGKTMAGDEDDPVCDGIVYKGPIPHDQLPQYYAAADAFVLPTQKEGCCNAIVEALAMGIPVISSNGAFNDDILDETNSIQIDPLNVNEIAAAILKMKNDQVFYNQLRNNLLTKTTLSITKRAESVLGFIEGMCE